ncbi:S8 family peptidase [Agriterribacter sp.]|uniref:S8 family peptidase n=1 Tax=Agriterribacter sp. TaxID=2821509 RepID=UPI002C039292|nr:S8 family serine peptidase [Agriterribacter sp.]HTN05383.1 S8 family serine peptidase [Agriterribacter sp.]
MKALVTQYLNIRTGFPALEPGNNPNDLFYKPGDAIDIVEPCFGETHRGNSIWYKLTDASYVWSGGVEDGRALFSLREIKTDVDFWSRRFGFAELRAQVADKLQQVRLSILDTGIDERHPDLQGLNIVKRFDATLTPDDKKTTHDTHGHGTHCAGILFGSGNKRITGVAKGVAINVCKIMEQPFGGGLSRKSILRALKEVGDQSDVISISAGIKPDDEELRNEIIALAGKGVVIVAAIGNQVNGNGFAVFPAQYNECISVGALNSNLEISDHTFRYNSTDICFPGDNIVSAGLADKPDIYVSDSGTSMATPFIAGLAAILKAHDNTLTYKEIRRKLLEWSEVKIAGSFSYTSIKDQKLQL